MALKYAELTDKIINAFYTVYNSLGWGFLEKVYENALAHELAKRGLGIKQQQRIDVFYDGVLVGDYFADIVVNNKVILELKAAEAISEAHLAQIINYLQATLFEKGLVMNFGPEPSFERRFYSNEKKKHLTRNPQPSAPSASSASYLKGSDS